MDLFYLKAILRLIDIQDQKGEISYNVNLYSEVVALADVLKDRTFADLDFSELEHTYTYANIRNSWQGILALENPLLAGTYAGTVGASTTGVLKYPFVDWSHHSVIRFRLFFRGVYRPRKWTNLYYKL
jgi:hypothetical protein